MCGITGFITTDFEMNERDLERMNNAIYRRGPDEAGLLFENNVGLAMRRLSIIDLKSGSQPIYNEDKSICVFFNGEIYNSPQLRDRLIGKGHHFETMSDTEVLVHLYEDFGDDMVLELEGMFAFVIWDKNRNRFLLARDHLGIKPLFYQYDEKGLFFGSEIKSLKEVPGQELSLNYQALDFYFTYTYIPAPYTIYKEISKLPAGHIMSYEGGKLNVRKYWDLEGGKKKMSFHQSLKKTKEEVLSSVKSHLLSDVPVGCFLSGGVDSSLVTAISASEKKDSIDTFTMSFVGDDIPLDDERKYAKKVSMQYATKFNDYMVPPDPDAILPQVIAAFDEPFSDDSIFPSYYVCELTAKKLKVALSGLGGDEVFAGYNRYSGLLLSKYYSILPNFLHKYIIHPIVKRLPEPKDGGEKIDHIKRFSDAALLSPAERYVGYLTAIKEIDREKLYSKQTTSSLDMGKTKKHFVDIFDSYDGDLISKALYTDMKTYLPEDILALSDRISMWHSLEVRVPLATPKLFELGEKISTKYKISLWFKKYILKKTAEEYVPKDVLYHKKQGFEAPMANWLKNDLKEYCYKVLSKNKIDQEGFFDPGYVKKILEDHFSGKRKNNKLIFSLLVFSEWLNQNPAVKR